MNDAAEPSKPASKLILVVEDTAEVADFIREILSIFGHRVEVSPGAKDALARFEPGKYALVITDYTMPEMNGADLARAIKKRSPGQLILLITGSAFSLDDAVSGPAPVDVILRKPFSITEFQQAMAELFPDSKESKS